MEGKITYFEKVGEDNTEAALSIAKQRADELGIKTILVASTRGNAAARAVDVFKGVKVIAVGHATGWREPNMQEFTDENKKKVESKGGVVLFASHAFTGLTRRPAPPPQPGEAPPQQPILVSDMGEIIANTYRTLSAGIKVVAEITLMAADAGLVRTDENIIVVTGSNRGLDTAAVVRPANSRDLFKLRIIEILCKPHFPAIPGAGAAAPMAAGAPAGARRPGA